MKKKLLKNIISKCKLASLKFTFQRITSLLSKNSTRCTKKPPPTPNAKTVKKVTPLFPNNLPRLQFLPPIGILSIIN